MLNRKQKTRENKQKTPLLFTADSLQYQGSLFVSKAMVGAKTEENKYLVITATNSSSVNIMI